MNLIYILGLILWLLLCYMLGFFVGNPVLLFVVLIPVIVFLFFAFRESTCVPYLGNLTSLTYILLIFFLVLYTTDSEDVEQFYNVALLAIALFFISLITYIPEDVNFMILIIYYALVLALFCLYFT